MSQAGVVTRKFETVWSPHHEVLWGKSTRHGGREEVTRAPELDWAIQIEDGNSEQERSIVGVWDLGILELSR